MYGMDKTVYAVVDTNVFVSALLSRNPESCPLQILAHIYRGVIIPVFNDEIIAEYREVLSREIFHFNPQDIEDALQTITTFGLSLNRTPALNEVFPDAKDIVFYEVKMSKDDAYLVTGNKKHFPKKSFVVTPREMIEILKYSEN